MTECPYRSDELQDARDECSPRSVLIDRVLYARRRGIREDRHAGEHVSWGQPQPGESAAAYLDRMVERAMKREARAARKGSHTNAKLRRNTTRRFSKGKTGAGYVEIMTTTLVPPALAGHRADIASLPPQDDDESQAHYLWRLKTHVRELRKQGRVHTGVDSSE